ncbi:MAG: amidohydrolase family protein [Nanoarchaeota archaeon]
MKDIIIKNGTIITQNGERSVIKGDIWIKEGIIKEVGTNILPDTATVIDAKDKLVLPGLINCHVHSDSYLYKGLGDNLRLFEQFNSPLLQKIWSKLSLQDFYYCALGTYCECLKNGITFVVDVPDSQYYVRELIRAMKLTKIRGAICSNDYRKDGRLTNEEFIELAKKARIMPLIQVPNEESINEEILSELESYDSYIKQGHIAECRERVGIINKNFDATLLELLDRHNFVNERLQIVHGNQLTSEEIELIRKKGASVIATPCAELKINDGMYKIKTLIDKNITIGLGTDGSIWNNSNDIFNEMKVLALSQFGTYGVKAITAQEILDMATINAARCFGIGNKLGSIEVGKMGDIILLDIGFGLSPVLCEPSNVVSNVVYCARGSDVTHVIIRGELVIKNGRFVHLDEDKIRSEIQDQAEKLVE